MVRVQEVFLHPCHVANAGVGSAHGVGKTLGGRAVENIAVGTFIFKGLGLQGTEPALCSLAAGCLVIGGRMSAVSLKLPHAPCAPYHLITFKCSCRASLWPLAEPFHPKLGLSL